LDIATTKSKIFGLFVKLHSMQKKTLQKQGSAKKPTLNPTYVKIGKCIRQARHMAKISNSRELSLCLGWSGGRINKFELGISTPGPDETVMLSKALKADSAWIAYGVGSPRAYAVYTTRYRNMMAVIDEVEAKAELDLPLESIKLTLDRLEKLRTNPLKKIPDVMA
jgi:hypothetical protein